MSDTKIINDYLVEKYGKGIPFGWGWIYKDTPNTKEVIHNGLTFIHTEHIADAEFPHITVAYRYVEDFEEA